MMVLQTVWGRRGEVRLHIFERCATRVTRCDATTGLTLC